MATSVSRIKGMTPEITEKLRANGITNTDQLLNASCTPAGRRELAKTIGIEPKSILEFANRADLARVKGIGDVFADLLENAGVDTVKELAGRSPQNLHSRLVTINSEQKLTRRAPTLAMITDWVTQAKELPKLLEY